MAPVPGTPVALATGPGSNLVVNLGTEGVAWNPGDSIFVLATCSGPGAVIFADVTDWATLKSDRTSTIVAVALYHRIMVTGDPTSMTILTIGTNRPNIAVPIVWAGLDPTDAIDVVAAALDNSSTGSGALVLASITAGTAKHLLAVYGAVDNAAGSSGTALGQAAFTHPGDMTELFDACSDVGADVSAGAAYLENVTGATGTRSVTGTPASLSNYRAAGFLLSVNPAAGGVTHQGTMSVSGGGEFTVTGQVGGTNPQGTIGVSGAGAFTAQGRKVARGGSIIDVAGDMTATGRKVGQGSIAVTGGGELAATGRKVARGTMTASGTGSFTATGRKIARGTLSVSGGGDLTVEGQAASVNPQGVMAVSGGGSFTAVGRKVARGALTVSGSGDLTVLGRKLARGVMAVSGGGSFTAASDVAVDRYFHIVLHLDYSPVSPVHDSTAVVAAHSAAVTVTGHTAPVVVTGHTAAAALTGHAAAAAVTGHSAETTIDPHTATAVLEDAV